MGLAKIKNTFNKKIGILYVLHNGDIKVEDNIVYLPYYLAFCL